MVMSMSVLLRIVQFGIGLDLPDQPGQPVPHLPFGGTVVEFKRDLPRCEVQPGAADPRKPMGPGLDLARALRTGKVANVENLFHSSLT